MSLSTTVTSAMPIPSDGLEQAAVAYRTARDANDRHRGHQAVGDAAQLTATLARLNITPILTGDPGDPSWDDPFHIEADGTVTTLIAQPTYNYGTGGHAVLQGRYVWACARQGWLWLRASDDHGEGLGEAGPLETLADVGRALVDGPITIPGPDLGELTETALQAADRDLDPAASVDTREICASLTGLTHAVLAVTEHITEQLADGSDALSQGLADLADRIGTNTSEPVAAAARSRWWRR
ncbi:hypothetical protein [Actinomadura hibisca]|uniref:hypothetical protein n=1 Tax=Actinomadura hibisca TaxID=68565 RepID=UPI0008321F46|nr:hypothetical protein [Actinomadura hibisca]